MTKSDHKDTDAGTVADPGPGPIAGTVADTDTGTGTSTGTVAGTVAGNGNGNGNGRINPFEKGSDPLFWQWLGFGDRLLRLFPDVRCSDHVDDHHCLGG
jgi:hypothetical protein